MVESKPMRLISAAWWAIASHTTRKTDDESPLPENGFKKGLQEADGNVAVYNSEVEATATASDNRGCPCVIPRLGRTPFAKRMAKQKSQPSVSSSTFLRRRTLPTPKSLLERIMMNSSE